MNVNSTLAITGAIALFSAYVVGPLASPQARPRNLQPDVRPARMARMAR
jgi:hypothetical protein